MLRFDEDYGKPAAESEGAPLAAASSFDLQAAVHAPREINRRRQDEVRRLVNKFKLFYDDHPAARARLVYFWTDEEQQDACLALLAHDIPADGDPLAPDVPDKKGKHQKKKRKKKFLGSTHGECVNWLGMVNKVSRFAAIQLKLPETFEPWITYTNRLVVYLFADIPDYEGPDDFVRLLNVSGSNPFPMKCGNPLCVKLAHIDYHLRKRRSIAISAHPRRTEEESDSRSSKSS